MRNWKKFLSSLDNLYSNIEMIEACKAAGLEELHKINRYSSRHVFALNDKFVIKIARSRAGMYQNWNEINIAQYLGDQRKLSRNFAKINLGLSDECNGRFIVMERLTGATRKVAALLQHDKLPELVEAINKVDKVMCMKNRQDLAGRQCGIDSNGRIKMLDYGANDQVLNMYMSARWARSMRNGYPNNSSFRNPSEEDVIFSEQ